MKKGEILKCRIGEERTNYQGVGMRIIDYRRMDDIDVLFLNGYGEIKKTRYCHFISGKVKCYSLIIGESSKNKHGDICTVVDIVGTTKVKVRYENGLEDVIKKSLFTTGSFKRPKKTFTLSDKTEIPGHNGYYADRDGNIYNFKGLRLIPVKRGSYMCVSLPDVNKEGAFKQYSIHRLIASTFIQNTRNVEQVNHKDGNKLNNNTSNLEWVTASENQHHRFAILNHSHLGEKNTQSKLTEEDVLAIVELRKSGCGCTELAKKFNISPPTICDIMSGRSWSHITKIKPQRNIERMKEMGYLSPSGKC